MATLKRCTSVGSAAMSLKSPGSIWTAVRGCEKKRQKRASDAGRWVMALE